uniref:Pentatricopeptide repeat-containing protein At4g20740 n=1 Tax=Anthurium amnicola TaxID=1678845 RepID=A0A1D1XCN3_9ARAE
MTSKSPASPAAAAKKFFYFGHRRPSRNRPVVHGGIFTNRTVLPSPVSSPRGRHPSYPAVDFRDWDPDPPPPPATTTPTTFSSSSAAARSLSPLARYVCDSIRRHGQRWCPAIVSDLNKLRRLTPDLVAEVLKVQSDPVLSSRFFHWAGKQKGYRHTFAAYNALAHCLGRSGRHRAADQVVEVMDAQGRPPSEKQFEILVRMHADAGRGLRVHHVFDKMRNKFKLKPRVFLYNRIMEALVRTGHLDLALSVYRDFKEDGLKEESVTFMVLAKGLCKGGRVDDALELLGHMREELCQPDVFAYTAMLKVMIGEGQLDGCLRLWEEMGKDQVEADMMAYTLLVKGLCKGGRVGKGLELFREMKRKGLLVDRAVYGALVDGLVAEGKVGAGCELLKEMVRDGYRADLAIYDSLISGLCGVGKVETAWKLFQITMKEDLVPGFKTVNPLLVSYTKAGQMEKMLGFVDLMGNLGLPVTDHLNDFLSLFIGKREQTLKALEVFETLKVKGFCSVSMYNVLIKGLHRIKEVKRALSLFQEMMVCKDYKPDSLTYSNIIPCFIDNEDITEACSCYNKTKEMSCTPSIEAYCSLVKALCKGGEINAALTLVKDCLANVTNGPMEFKYTLTVLHACKSGDPEKVVAVLDEMMEQGIPLEEVVYCAIINGFVKYASSEEARKVFAIMRKRNLLTDANCIIYDDMLNEHLKRTTAGLMLSGLKFFGLESKLKLTSSLTYPR